MKLTLLLKLAVIGAISLLLLIPLMRIWGLVNERRQTRDAAVEDIARSAGFAQTITGPVLVIPATRTVRKGNEEQEVRVLYYVLPERLDADASLATELRSRGIYRSRLYRTTAALRGHFQVPTPLDTSGADERLRFERPWLALGITDIRGIGTGLAARIDGMSATFQSGTAVPFLGSGVHAPLPVDVTSTPGARIEFDIALPLQGTDSFQLVPAGRETHVALRSTWPHPSFIGSLLPVSRDVGPNGFDAQWQTSFFATNLEELTHDCARRGDCKSLDAPRFGVSLIDPVDAYAESERAIKYAMLFIALTFAGFLLCEVLKGANVHPMQYGLVGLALALFYLLLLSLSEHVGFAAAYALSAAATVALLGYYLRHVFDSFALGAGFGSAFGVLYALLYGILAAEDYALLMGSLLLFGVLALFMILTRRVDWNAVRAG